MPASPKSLSGKALGKYLAERREAGTPWGDATSGLVAEVGAKSAIPLRVPLREFLVSLDAAKAAKRYPREFAKVAPAKGATDAEIVALRDEKGEGFPLIAAKTGLSVKDVVAAYGRGNGVSASGRVYVGSAGRTLVSGNESVRIDAPAKKGKKGAKKARKARKAA